MVFIKDWQKEEIEHLEFYFELENRLNRRISMASPS
jgi:hypothetical protein